MSRDKMALHKFNESLGLANSLLENVKSEAEEILYFGDKVSALHGDNEKTIKRLIDIEQEVLQSLTQEYENSEKELKESGLADSLLKDDKENKTEQMQALTNDISNLEKQKAEFDKELSQLSEQFKVLGEKKANMLKESSQHIPWRKGELALFTTTTGIRWNFGCNAHEIRGYVACKNGIQPFSINSNEHDSFHVANYLWDVIESAYNA